jgi:hypothetical protein
MIGFKVLFLDVVTDTKLQRVTPAGNFIIRLVVVYVLIKFNNA